MNLPAGKPARKRSSAMITPANSIRGCRADYRWTVHVSEPAYRLVSDIQLRQSGPRDEAAPDGYRRAHPHGDHGSVARTFHSEGRPCKGSAHLCNLPELTLSKSSWHIGVESSAGIVRRIGLHRPTPFHPNPLTRSSGTTLTPSTRYDRFLRWNRCHAYRGDG